MEWIPGLTVAIAHYYISSRSIVLALLLTRVVLGDPDKSFVLVQSQVEAYILTLLALASKRNVRSSILPVDTRSWDSLAHTRTQKAIILKYLSVPWP